MVACGIVRALYIEKAFITRFVSDVLKRRKLQSQSRNIATIDAHGYDYFIAITILYCLCWLASLGGLANSVYVAIFIISAWGLELLVLDCDGQFLRPQDMERVMGTVSTSLCIYTESENLY